jgi:pullulanase
MSAVYDILSNLVPVHCENPHVLAFQLSGNVPGEPADEMFIVFNAADSAVSVGLPKGTWTICVDGDHAGTGSLGTAENGVTIAPISAMVLIKGSLK